MRSSTFRRTLRAQWRDVRVLFRESRTSLILFLVVLGGGALIFHHFYVYPDTQTHPSYGEALHATFALVFFETLLPLPPQWYLQIFFYLIPILGLAAVADGVLRFGAALMNKQSRGQAWQIAMASTYEDHVILCGVGKVGYRVLLELLKFERDVVAIERNENGRFVDKVKALEIPLIIANARRSENIRKAGVERADAIIPCTDDELTNLDIALDAREINPEIKVVMRMFDNDLAQRVERGFGIHTAFSTSALAAPIFAAAAMRLNVRHSFYVDGELLNLSEVEVEPGSELIGWTIERLVNDLDISVVCHHTPAGADLHPDPDRTLQVGDRILILASLSALRRMHTMGRAPQ